jgi:hypothetical protein
LIPWSLTTTRVKKPKLLIVLKSDIVQAEAKALKAGAKALDAEAKVLEAEANALEWKAKLLFAEKIGSCCKNDSNVLRKEQYMDAWLLLIDQCRLLALLIDQCRLLATTEAQLSEVNARED